jgi:Bacterial dnaA  protein
VVEESVRRLSQARDIEKAVAFLRSVAEEDNVRLPRDVALYIAQNVRSSERTLRDALRRLLAHSLLTHTQITLTYTQRVLTDFIEHARAVRVDRLEELPYQQFGTKEAKNRRPGPVAGDHDFVFWLLTTQDGRRTSRVRYELEVNMRESERERLARRDACERDLERRAKKRRQG